MRRDRYLSAALATLVLALGLPSTVAAAVPDTTASTTTDFTDCTAADVEAGDCLLWVAPTPQEADVAAVAQALERGQTEAAHAFVEKRASVVSDAKQEELESILSSDESEVATKSLAAGPWDPPVGEVSGFLHIINEPATYGYYNTDGELVTVGQLQVLLYYNLEGALEYSIQGDISIVSGPGVAFPVFECRTVHEEIWPLPEVTVWDWPNCRNYAQRNYYTTFPASVPTENWSGGTPGETYHPEYEINWRPQIAGAPLFGLILQAHSYRIENPPGVRPTWILPEDTAHSPTRLDRVS